MQGLRVGDIVVGGDVVTVSNDVIVSNGFVGCVEVSKGMKKTMIREHYDNDFEVIINFSWSDFLIYISLFQFPSSNISHLFSANSSFICFFLKIILFCFSSSAFPPIFPHHLPPFFVPIHRTCVSVRARTLSSPTHRSTR